MKSVQTVLSVLLFGALWLFQCEHKRAGDLEQTLMEVSVHADSLDVFCHRVFSDSCWTVDGVVGGRRYLVHNDKDRTVTVIADRPKVVGGVSIRGVMFTGAGMIFLDNEHFKNPEPCK